MNTFTCGWYLIYTRPSLENKVARQLSQIGINFLLPKTRILRQWHDRKKLIDKPLFPSYIFVKITSLPDYYNCTKIDGFCFFIKFGNQFTLISQKIIDDISLITDKGSTVEASSDSIEPGEKMIIRHGPLCGLSCEVVKYNGKQKVCVRINLIGRTILADVPSALLQVDESGEYGRTLKN